MDIRLDRPIVFVDLETTGLNPSYDRIVEITAIKVHRDGSEEQRTVRINPEMRIPAAATSVHGITDEDVVNQPPFSRYAKNLLAFLDGTDLAGFNAIRFDLPMLRPGSSAQELVKLFQGEGISRFATSIPYSQQLTVGNM